MELVASLDDFLIEVIEILDNRAIEAVKAEEERVEVKTPTPSTVLEEKPQSSVEINHDETMLFLSNTVHDIRTPANSLYGLLDLMEEQVKDERLLSFIANAKESAQFIHTLTDTILAKVKHEKESMESIPTVINTIKFFSSIANIFSANMFKKEIKYLIYIDPLIPKEIEIEELKIKRVLLNLIGNSYKFTPKDKTITFSITYNQEAKELNFSIKDTGIGIAKENQASIFKAFEQAEADTALHFGGTGLGLAISAKYVKDLSGKLELESEIDQGSNFFFALPIKAINQSPAHYAFANTSHYVTILTDYFDCVNANTIKRYLEALNIPKENITISHKISANTTHLICFEHRLNSKVISVSKEHNMKLIGVEEQLFSISKNIEYKDIQVISENSYYGDTLYTFISFQRKPRVLIVDDNKINAMLIKTILESEYCEIHYSLDGQEALDVLIEGLKINNPFSVIFADKHIPTISGSQFHLSSPLVAISITGDPIMSDEEKALYDLFVAKPFNKDEVRQSLYQALNIEK